MTQSTVLVSYTNGVARMIANGEGGMMSIELENKAAYYYNNDMEEMADSLTLMVLDHAQIDRIQQDDPTTNDYLTSLYQAKLSH